MTKRVNAIVGVAWLVTSAVVGASALGCSRNNIEAVNLSNEGDKARAVNIDEAISKYDQAAKLDPENHRILYKLARGYEKKEDWPKVASTISQAEKAEERVNKKKTFANYYWLHGMALKHMAEKGAGGWADARGPLETATQLDPNLADAFEDLGDVLLRLDDEQGALQNYTKAIEKKPDEVQFYANLAELYTALNYLDQAEQVLKEAVTFGKQGDKGLFRIHGLLGGVYERKGNMSGAVAEYEAAKKSCGQCDDHKEAFFLLGAAYAQTNPPRKNEAIQQLQSFHKITCKGALAQRFGDMCAQAQELAHKLGGALQ